MSILELRMDAEIHGRDGKYGKLTGVAINPTTYQATQLITKQGLLFKHERAIPISLVSDTSTQQLTLDATADELNEYPEYHELILKEKAAEGDSLPPMQEAQYNTPTQTTAAPTSTHIVQKKVREGVDEDALVLRQNTTVAKSTKGKIGKLSCVTVDEEDYKLNSLIIGQGGFFNEDMLIPFDLVEQFGESNIQISGTQ